MMVRAGWLRPVLRVLAAAAVVAFYLAFWFALSTVQSLHVRSQFESAPVVGARAVAAMDLLQRHAKPAGTPLSDAERSAVDEIERAARYFSSISMSSYESGSRTSLAEDAVHQWLEFRTTGTVPDPYSSDPSSRRQWLEAVRRARSGAIDPEGQLTFARRYLADLPAAVQVDRDALGREVDAARRRALTWAAAGAVLCGVPLAAAWQRRRITSTSEILRIAAAFAPRRPSWWYRPVHVSLTTIGFVLLWAGIIGVAVVVRLGADMGIAPALAVALGFTLCTVGGAFLLRYARPRSARDAVRALRADPRQPVFYLRSFSHDATAAVVDPGRLPVTMAAAEIESREEGLVAALGTVGPVIAVGRPGEHIPPIGAARLYLPGDRWQPMVARIMDLSGLVVLRLGDGGGLRWEFERATRYLSAYKVIVLVPRPLTAGLVAEMDRHLARASNLAEVAATSGDAWTCAVVSFEPGWTARVVPVGPILGEKSNLGAPQQLAKALQTALEAVGVRRRMLTYRLNLKRLANMGKLLLAIPVLALALQLYAMIRDW